MSKMEVERDPLEIFPKEIWMKIFEHLQSTRGGSHDLQNCFETCTTFQDFLTPNQNEWQFELILPFVFPYLNRESIKTARLTGKTWCRVVDQYLENLKSVHPFTTETTNMFQRVNPGAAYNPIQQKKVDWTTFKTKERFSAFTERMSNIRGNPFVGRSVTFFCHSNDTISAKNEYWAAAAKFVSVFGKHIYYLELKISGFESAQFLDIVRQLLIFLPNLKGLDVAGMFSYLPPGFQQIQLDPLPQIRSLENLKLHVLLHRISFVQQFVGINGNNLKRLFLELGSETPRFIASLKGVLPNLTDLHLNARSVEMVETVCDMLGPKAPLEKLNLFMGLGTSYDYPHLCRNINRFGGSLKYLAIEGLGYLAPPDFLSTLNVPHVKKLVVGNVLLQTHVLLPSLSASLEYLCISYYYDQLKKDEVRRSLDLAEMNLFKCVENRTLHHAQIWDEFLNLKTVKITCDAGNSRIVKWDSHITCTRELHNQLNAHNGPTLVVSGVPETDEGEKLIGELVNLLLPNSGPFPYSREGEQGSIEIRPVKIHLNNLDQCNGALRRRYLLKDLPQKFEGIQVTRECIKEIPNDMMAIKMEYQAVPSPMKFLTSWRWVKVPPKK